MPRPEKLRLMEALWTDLSLNDGALESPAWHEWELRQTEERRSAGAEEAIEWDAAKRMLRGECVVRIKQHLRSWLVLCSSLPLRCPPWGMSLPPFNLRRKR
jgi:hypothetical protein